MELWFCLHKTPAVFNAVAWMLTHDRNFPVSGIQVHNTPYGGKLDLDWRLLGISIQILR